ncbi:MAG: acetate kinase [Intrasporangiaceae bacterium]|nr:acetate kinase [Intrasporangiaceae bacterium]
MTAPLVLVVNSGSSSLKYQLIDPRTGENRAKGTIERIGEPGSDVADHAAALHRALEQMGDRLDPAALLAVGHRVVHGGSRFSAATVIDEDVCAAIADLAPLAPLHNPANLLGIEATAALFPDVPQVAVFDTAFHHSLPAEAYTYAVPREWRESYGVRRYGFHGTSLSYVARRAARLLGKDLAETDLVVLHLGNGCSACAVRGGESVETSMGLSPLEGLVMGTRSGDVDPSLGAYLHRIADLDAPGYDRALNKESGMLALAGVSDLRLVEERAATGDEDATLALDVMVHRLVKYVGAYAAVLGRVDALVLTGGIGEHSDVVRGRLAKRLSLLGIELDEEANESGSGERAVTTAQSRTAMLVIPTNEELEIATQTAELILVDGD